MPRSVSHFVFSVGAGLVVACSGGGPALQTGETRVSPTQESIQRDFVNVACLECHRMPTAKNRNVGLSDIGAILENGSHDHGTTFVARKIIRPGCPKQSLFLSILKEGKMPPKGKVPGETLDAIETWITSLDPAAEKTCERDEPTDGEKQPGEPGN